MSKKIIETEIYITDMEFPNKGISSYNDEKVYVKNAILNQRLRVSLKRKRRKYEAKILEVLEKSPVEIDSNCSEFPLCGGCTYQNLPYDEEIKIKEKMVLDIFKNNGLTNFEYLGINKSPSTNAYRNKMEFSFGDTQKDGELTLGMRKKNSYYEVSNGGNCQIVSSNFTKIVDCVVNFFKNSNENFYHKTKKTGTLRHLLVREAYFTKQILINIVTSSNIKTNLTPLMQDLLSLNIDGNIKGIIHITNDAVADIIKVDKMNILYGVDYFYEKLLGLDFKISLFSFFQTNSQGAEKLYNIVKKFVGETKNQIVFDLYCGTGTIAQIVAKEATKVIGIEIVEAAIVSAKENAKLNNIYNCEFIAGDVYKLVSELNVEPDLIILDPPREGINPKALPKLIAFNSPKIVYISCKASSLAKDLLVFIENGYKIDKVEIMDMFPRTYHMEVIILLVKI